MAETQTSRLDRIAQKIDKLSDAMISLARAEEKLISIEHSNVDLKVQINDMRESSYIDRAEKELGELILHDWEFENIENGYHQLVDKESPEEKEHNRKVFERAKEIEQEEFNELWVILKGQNYDEFQEIYQKLPEEEKMKHDHWESWFDGSGIKTWWD